MTPVDGFTAMGVTFSLAEARTAFDGYVFTEWCGGYPITVTRCRTETTRIPAGDALWQLRRMLDGAQS